MSLKELVEKHGFNIRVQSYSLSNPSFIILREAEDDRFYYVQYFGSMLIGRVLKECIGTNDYHFVERIS
jgi:hypothetical protein